MEFSGRIGAPTANTSRQPARAAMSWGRRVRLRVIGRNFVWFMMTLPALIWIIVFKYLTLAGVWIAFIDYKVRTGMFASQFVGLKNFKFLFSTDTALRATRNTLILNAMFITVGLFASLIVAWLLFSIYTSKMTRYYQTLILLPRFISWVVVSYFVYALLAAENGVVNSVLKSLGVSTSSWYRNPAPWPFILLAVSLWHGVGLSSLIYLSGMIAIDPQLYEAARIDGASRWHQFRFVTLPILLPLIIINLLLSLAYVLNADFGLFFQVTRDQQLLYPSTDVLDTYIYRSLIVTKTISMAAAAQFYQSIVGFVLVIVANGLVRRIERARGESLALF
jgi:putative aldouronate transport system permease protein